MTKAELFIDALATIAIIEKATSGLVLDTFINNWDTVQVTM